MRLTSYFSAFAVCQWPIKAPRLLELWRAGIANVAVAAVALGAAPATSDLVPYKNLSLAQLMDIEVTSVSRRTESLAETPSAIQVVTGEDIHRAGAQRLPDALRLVSNLQVAQIDARQWAITSRGFNNTLTNKLLVLLDGRTLYTPLYAGVFWDVQDTFLEDVDRIEVISGPGATQWGSNAVNGVINITTKDAKDTQGGLLTAAAGSELRAAGGARYGSTLGANGHFRVYGKYTEVENSITPAGQNARDAWDMTQGGFRADWVRLATDHLTVQGDAYKGEARQTTNDDIDLDGANLLGRWTRTFAPHNNLTVQAYYDYTHRSIPGTFVEHMEIYDLDVQRTLSIGSTHQLVFGGNYRRMHDTVRNSATIAFFPRRVTRDWYSGFVQDEMRLLAGQLRLIGGLKLEHNPYTGTESQPSLRAAWNVSERRMLWAAFSRAFRTPSRIDRELFSPANPPHIIAGGPNFQSEELRAYELGFRTEVRPGLAVSLSTFFHDYDDLRSLEPSPIAGGPAVLANGLTGKSKGAELSLDYRVTDTWRFRLGYTEQRVSSKTKPGSLDSASVRSQVLDPKRHAMLLSQFDLSRRTALNVAMRYVGRIENQSVPAYVEADLRLSWRPIDQLELAVTGKNLLDASHPEFGSPAARREIERSVTGSLTWRF